jgi:hypothetical protein
MSGFLRNVTKSNYYTVPISELLRELPCVSNTIPVHLEPGAILSGSDYYNVYISHSTIQLTNNLPPAQLDSGIIT